MRYSERQKQYRNSVQEMLNSNQSDMLYSKIREILTHLGYDESKLTYYLRSKFIKLDIHPTTIDIIIKNKDVATISVSEMKIGHSTVYDCDIDYL